MQLARYSLSVFGIVSLVAATVAGAFIWLLVTDPVRGADTVGQAAAGDVSPLVRALAGVLYDALRDLLKYL